MVEQQIRIAIQGEAFVFDAGRTVFWERRRILMAADLHWGKAHYLRSHGIPVPEGVFESDLARLSTLLQRYQPETLLILGDLIHHERALSPVVREKVLALRHRHPCELILVKGNHDRYIKFPERWGIVEEESLTIDGFDFIHGPSPRPVHYEFAGHLHPMLSLRSSLDKVRLPAFLLNSQMCLLPAFTELSGGMDMRLKPGERGLMVLPEGLLDIER